MKKLIFVLMVCCFIFSGCESNRTSIDEGKFNIVTSFYPVYVATSNIIDGVDGVTIDNMTNTQVGCLHDYQLTTRDMNKLEKADVFIINGCGMETFLDKAIGAYPELNIIDSSEGILEQHNEMKHAENKEDSSKLFDDIAQVNDIGNGTVVEFEEENLYKDEHAENEKEVSKIDIHEHVDIEEEAHKNGHNHNHDHGENAHIWVSIDLYIKQVENISKELSEIDPKNSEKYMGNANVYIEKLKSLNLEMHEKIDNLGNKNIVTFHEAFDFFAEDFGLNVVAVVEREPGTNPSAGEVAKIIDKVRETDAVAIFVEPQYETSTANVIARETGIPVYILDPIVSGNLDKEEYERIMRKNLEVLEEALK